MSTKSDLLHRISVTALLLGCIASSASAQIIPPAEPLRLPDLSPQAQREALENPPPMPSFEDLFNPQSTAQEESEPPAAPIAEAPSPAPAATDSPPEFSGDFPEIVFPENTGQQEPDLKLFESWLDEEKKETTDDTPAAPSPEQATDIPPKPEPAEPAKETAETTATPLPKTLPELPEIIEDTVAETPEAVTPKPKSKPKKRGYEQYSSKKMPFVYKSWRLPQTIYKARYSRENEHLPIATYEEEYDAQLFAAAARDDVPVLRAFLDLGKSPDMLSPAGEGLLLHAVRHRAINTVRLLLAKGADPNIIAENGGSPLHFAVANWDYPMAEALLAGGAEPRQTDRGGMSALQMAQENGSTDILQAMQRVLRKHNRKL